MSYSGCGFIGAFAFEGYEKTITELPFSKMLDSIKHRGPDYGSTWEERGIKLGHRRLSIIDLSNKGNQPMTLDLEKQKLVWTKTSGTSNQLIKNEHYTISYNGELYNYKTLRAELIDYGFNFETDTDTEVVLKAYVKWGTNAINKFIGMFAFAIWDSKKQELFLSRDRLGIKPLYFYNNNKLIIFGSEVQSLMHSGQIPALINMESLKRQVHLSTFFDYKPNETLVKDVFSLEPGTYLIIKPNDNKLKPVSYYTIAKNKVQPFLTDKELGEQLSLIFSNSVNEHLVSDVPVAAFLSGGLDSSLICALAANKIKNLTAITVDYHGGSKDKFTGENNNDVEYSKMLAKYLDGKIDHKIVELEPAQITIDNIDAITDLAMVTDDDRLLTIYSNYNAVKQLGIKVVLNGQGADEIMGGYIAYYDNCKLNNIDFPLYERVENVINMLSFMQDKNLSEEMLACKEKTHEDFLKYYSSFPGKPIEKHHRMLVTSELRRILKFEDYLSMQHSIECRVPFLDHRLVDWCFQIPFEKHIEFTKPPMGKMILRKIAKTILPKKLVDRPKQVFPSSDENLFHKELLRIFNNNKDAILNCKSIQAVYTDSIKNDCSELSFKELWFMVSLWRWEIKLRNYEL